MQEHRAGLALAQAMRHATPDQQAIQNLKNKLNQAQGLVAQRQSLLSASQVDLP